MEVVRSVYREDHEQFRATVRRFLERECLPRQEQWLADGIVDRETWLKAGREGLLCTALPAEYGGGGGDFGHAAVIAEEMAYTGVSVSFGLHSDIVAPYIARLGTEAQKQRWLPGVCAGETILAVAITEPGGGSDVKACRTTAVRDGDEWVINGSKTFISNGFISDMVMVVCKTDPAAGAKGVSLIMVETDRAGFRRGRKLQKVGMHSQDTAELFFDNVRVPADNLLGEVNKGFGYLMHDLAQERFIVAVMAAAKLERLLEQTLEYVKDRKAFGGTIWDFQNTKFKLADVKANAVALRTMVDYYLGKHISRGLSGEEAAIAKLHATEVLWKCLDDMVQLHGGYGYMLEYPIARAFVDMRIARVYGGSNEVMRDIITRKM
ncbi:acyl-CoA dehydrogenase family protein [Cupriavidus alkaliphilus]|uniref:acyl-CoA dehydrogenase family protein n=1 Tax=Cupriavidus alkaliphilus TaxID=942866 RepID=UPI000DC4FA6A|nr:acyl-CoA dehydrogenase family protein [Cupriavidus alkaliphilus]RAS03493.1 acyl-CoA dehydrogenase [Cupriavidus alkaliphilus]